MDTPIERIAAHEFAVQHKRPFVTPGVAIHPGQKHCGVVRECLQSPTRSFPVRLAQPAIELNFWSHASFDCNAGQEPRYPERDSALSSSNLCWPPYAARLLKRGHEGLHVRKNRLLIESQTAILPSNEIRGEAANRSGDLLLKTSYVLAQPGLPAVAIS